MNITSSLRKAMVIGAIFGAVYSTSASATIYEFEDLNANNGGFADRLDTVSSTYNDVTEQFTWDVTFNSDPTDVDGFWLVVNNGPNPKSVDVNELAIIYGDLDTGVASTYVYNGQNNANSILNPSILLQTDLFSVTSNGFSLSIDASGINAYSGWDTPDVGGINGIGFDDQIGIWFHVATGSSFGTNSNGDITSFQFGSQGWYDRANLSTVQVPAPASSLLMVLGLVGLLAGRNRRAG